MERDNLNLEANPILVEVLKLFRAQQHKGLLKYGVLVKLDNYSILEWLEHSQQEMLDSIVYLECIKQKFKESPPLTSEQPNKDKNQGAC